MSHAQPNLAHQFDTIEQQREAGILGMWAFLLTEIMLFAGLFVTYAVYRYSYATAFSAASHHLDVFLGAVNTVILIVSSLTMVLAVHAAKHGANKQVIQWLLATMAFGGAFLAIKAVEYGHKFHEHLIPGAHFVFELAYRTPAQIFFVLYFTMTGVHAFHMVVGIGLLSWLVYKALRQGFTAGSNAPVEICGLYWHLIDIIWIFLFPLLYLLGRH
jgi:cytochrome c oxidase subunit 3